MEGQIIELLWKTAWHYFLKPNLCLGDDSAIALVGLYIQEKSLHVFNKDMCKDAPNSITC